MPSQADIPRPGDAAAPPPAPCRGWAADPTDPTRRETCSAIVQPIPKRTSEGRLTWFPATQCSACAEKETWRTSQLEYDGRRARSGIPTRYADYSLRRVVQQARDEQPLAFMERVTRLPAPTVGVTTWNHRAVTTMRDWKPGRSGLYLTGPVGGGKTMLVCAMLTDFMRAGMGVLYLTESVLYGWLRVHAIPRPGQAGHSAPDLPRDARSIPLLALDDIGSTADLTDRQRDTFEAIVCARYDRNLPVVVTSNYTIAAIAGRAYYGERVASRLTEMCGRQQIHLVGYDWRTGNRHATQAQPQPSPIPTRTPTSAPDYKRAASGDRDD